MSQFWVSLLLVTFDFIYRLYEFLCRAMWRVTGSVLATIIDYDTLFDFKSATAAVCSTTCPEFFMLQLVQDPNMSVLAASLLPKSCPRTRRLKIDVITCTMSYFYHNDYIYMMHKHIAIVHNVYTWFMYMIKSLCQRKSWNKMFYSLVQFSVIILRNHTQIQIQRILMMPTHARVHWQWYFIDFLSLLSYELREWHLI